MARTTRGCEAAKTSPSRSMSGSSAMAIDDPGAVEVVGGKLDPNAVARKDADPEPAHLAGHVTEDRTVHVVELDAEHRVGQCLDDLPLELELLFLGHYDLTVVGPDGVAAAEARSVAADSRAPGLAAACAAALSLSACPATSGAGTGTGTGRAHRSAGPTRAPGLRRARRARGHGVELMVVVGVR